MTDEERVEYQAAAQVAAQRQQIENLANQARDGAIAALRGETDREQLITNIEHVAAQIAQNGQPQPGGPWHNLTAYLQAVIALLRGESLPPVPQPYAAHIAAIQNAAKE